MFDKTNSTFHSEHKAMKLPVLIVQVWKRLFQPEFRRPTVEVAGVDPERIEPMLPLRRDRTREDARTSLLLAKAL